MEFEKAISQQLCKITDELRKIRTLNEAQEARDVGVVYIAIPLNGTTRNFSTGTTKINFLSGVITNPDNSTEQLDISLQRLAKDFLHSLSLTSDQDIILQIGNLSKQPVQATLGLELPYLNYNEISITTTTTTNISIYASTNPFSTVNGNTVSIMKGQYNGQPVTIALDSSGNIVAMMQGQYAGSPKVIATDADGKIQALLYGMYGGNPTAVAVDSGGKLVIMNLSQSNIEGDLTEATTWDNPVSNLQNNLNKIRNQIITITGEAWGTVSHSIATVWAKFNATTGHKHTGAADDAPNIAWASVTKSGSNISDLATKSHTSLSDIGSNTHAAIDTHIGAYNTHAAATASVHNFDGSGNAPAQSHGNSRHSSVFSIIGSGSYSGNNTANRAVAHGLGVTPKLIYFSTATGLVLWQGISGNMEDTDASATANYAVTGWDASNFYVGNAGGYARSANASGTTYYWIAFG